MKELAYLIGAFIFGTILGLALAVFASALGAPIEISRGIINGSIAVCCFWAGQVFVKEQ